MDIEPCRKICHEDFVQDLRAVEVIPPFALGGFWQPWKVGVLDAKHDIMRCCEVGIVEKRIPIGITGNQRDGKSGIPKRSRTSELNVPRRRASGMSSPGITKFCRVRRPRPRPANQGSRSTESKLFHTTKIIQIRNTVKMRLSLKIHPCPCQPNRN